VIQQRVLAALRGRDLARHRSGAPRAHRRAEILQLGVRVASFVSSFNAADVGWYQIVGTKGDIRVDPGYEYADGLSYALTVNGKTTRVRVGKRDQFAPELLYFSDCILKNREPEPSGADGLQDVRIVEALYQSARTGKAVPIPKYRAAKQPPLRQRIVRPGIAKPSIVQAKSGSD